MKYTVLVNEKGTFWFKEGTSISHRLDGPAYEYANGDKIWYINGKLHREGGPAIECSNGDKYWYFNGKLHRLDGPAIELADGRKEWHYQDQLIECNSQKEFEIWLQKHYPKTLNVSKPKHLLKPQI